MDIKESLGYRGTDSVSYFFAYYACCICLINKLILIFKFIIILELLLHFIMIHFVSIIYISQGRLPVGGKSHFDSIFIKQKLIIPLAHKYTRLLGSYNYEGEFRY